MKARLFALFTPLLIVGNGSPDLDDPETLDKIIAEAIDSDNLQKRVKEGEELLYAPNEQKPFTGWVKRMWDNGQVMHLYSYKDGERDGLETEWYENGQKKEEGNYKDGKVEGLATAWHKNGHKMMEGNYKDGKRDRILTMWYENGRKKWEGNFRDGKENGLSTAWYENGRKKAEGNFKDDKIMSAEAWKPNGEKCPVTNVKDGNGVVVFYYDDGTELSRSKYSNGKEVWD